MKAISTAARESVACVGDTTDASLLVNGDQSYNKELKIQQEKTERILLVISSKVKSWVYKLVYSILFVISINLRSIIYYYYCCNNIIFRVVGWFTFRMISLLATSLVVQPSQIDRVRDAEQSGLPVIYLPLHKSHMDYILLGLVLTVHNIKPPLVAAGENLRVFFFRQVLLKKIILSKIVINRLA